jgi:hypothetical protein
MIEFDLVIWNILLADAAHLPITTHYFQHDISGNSSFDPSAVFRFSERLGRKKYWANMAKDRATQFFGPILVDPFPPLWLQ